jgi:hypothetical protein
MVSGYPGVQIQHIYGGGANYPTEPENIAIGVIECTKGKPFDPVFITEGNAELNKKFKMIMPQFVGCGGKAGWFIRATAGEPVQASEKIFDDSATSNELAVIKNKSVGSYTVMVTCTEDANGIFMVVEEDGYQTERYSGLETIQALVDKINTQSEIIEAEFTAERGTGSKVTTVVSHKLGSTGTGSVAGTDGTVDTEKDDGSLLVADAPIAHETALAKAELLENPMAGVVFTTSPFPTVHAKYATHVTQMSSPLKAKWRIGVWGADKNVTVSDRAVIARQFNEEEIMYIAHSLYDAAGNYYAPNQMAAAVAGKMCGTPYGNSIWGGAQDKILGIGSNNFFTDLGEVLDDTDVTILNEAGAITFKNGQFGFSIREGVTTAQSSKAETDADSVSEVRIVQHACREIQKAAEQMVGEKITPTFQNDLKSMCTEPLETMYRVDGTLVDVPEEGLNAYDLDVAVIPRAQQKLGRADINFEITIAETNRQTYGRVVVR